MQRDPKRPQNAHSREHLRQRPDGAGASSFLLPAVLYEDSHLIVIDKPAGLLSQGEETGSANVVDWLRERWGRPFVGLVHRLDRNTSGLMVVAKRTKSANRLTESLQSGELDRRYLGWLEGVLGADAYWSHLLVKDERQNRVTARRVSAQPRNGGEKPRNGGEKPRNGGEKPSAGKASSLWARPQRRAQYRGGLVTLVEFTLETGRSHQIRAQSSAEGYPLLGDAKYGAKQGFARTALHSARLEFPHPMGGGKLVFTSGLPPDLAL